MKCSVDKHYRKKATNCTIARKRIIKFVNEYFVSRKESPGIKGPFEVISNTELLNRLANVYEQEKCLQINPFRELEIGEIGKIKQCIIRINEPISRNIIKNKMHQVQQLRGRPRKTIEEKKENKRIGAIKRRAANKEKEKLEEMELELKRRNNIYQFGRNIDNEFAVTNNTIEYTTNGSYNLYAPQDNSS